MKRIFTSVLLLAAAAWPTVNAQSVDQLRVQSVAETVDQLPLSGNSGLIIDRPTPDPVAPYSVPDDTSADTWTSLGYGTFTEPAISSVFTAFSSTGPWEVEIEQSVEHPAYYRLKNPYGEKWGYYNSGKYKVRDEDSYLTFYTGNPEKVIFATTKSYNTLFGYTPLNVQISSTYGEANLFDYGAPYGSYGTLSDGNIVFPASCFYVYMGSKLYKVTNDLKISLPGAADNSTNITIDNNCYADNQIPYTITTGADVKNVKTLIASGARYTASTANLKLAVSYGTASSAGQHVLDVSTATSFTTGTISDGWISIFAASHDDSGNLLEGAVAFAFATIHNDSEWRSLGTTKFTDDTYSRPILGVTTIPAARDVEILQNIADPRKFRLVNAFATSSLSKFSASTMYDGYTDGHNHFTDIIVYRADSVVIPERPMGLTISGYKLSLTNYSAGTVTGRNITFPTSGLRIGVGQSYYTANVSGGFNLVLPRYDVVVTVTAGDAPVVGATVTVGDASAVTNEQGQATVSTYGLSGTVEVTAVSADQALSGTSSFDVEAGTFDYNVGITLGQATAIDKVTAPTEKKDAAIYDLNGRRVSNPANNYIYIMGGKKVIIAK